MCGIIGYVGSDNAVRKVLRGLKFLEYRGYDSSGIAIASEGKIFIRKKEGRVKALENCLDSNPVSGNTAIGHTRWATHGEPSDNNAHPFVSNDGIFAVVHNGIIENYLALKELLISKGFVFHSQTDSEVIANLIQFCYKEDSESAILEAVSYLKGSYAIGIIVANEADKIYAVKKDNPLIVATNGKEGYICSDMIAICDSVNEAIVLDNCRIAVVNKDSIVVKTFCGTRVNPIPIPVNNEFIGLPYEFECFMRKEIDVIPDALKRALSDYRPVPDDITDNINRICFIGCGTALHAGMAAKYILRRILPSFDIYSEAASEFIYMDFPINNTLTVAISQSGETADTLLAVKKIKEHGGKVVAVCNVPTSSLVRESDFTIFTNAGPEIAVASTKAYNCQNAVLTRFCLDISVKYGGIDNFLYSSYIKALSSLPSLAQKTLSCENSIAEFSKVCYTAKSVFYLGRGLDFFVACEGSLKLKEISYIHSEAYAGGELKHGTLALMENGVIVVALITQSETMEKMYANLVEVKSRGAKILSITPFKNKSIAYISDYTVYIPQTDDILYHVISVIPTQFIAYYTALAKGCDIDKPRNLAKSVTVE